MDYLKKAELAIHYLAESEQEYARLYALDKYSKERMKMYLATLETESNAKTVAAKLTEALAHPEYEQTVNSFETITEQYKAIAEKRRRAETTIEMYRSVNSALKRGNI